MLALHKIAKHYGTRTIFKNVSCSIGAGSISLLVGANGAGKSTLLKIMAGLASPSAGTIDRSDVAENAGYLGHATFLYPALTACENLAFWAEIYHKDSSRAFLKALLNRVQLARHAEERAGVFSRGMAQRLNLARILLLEPQLLLLDEPSTGLDTVSCTLLHTEILRARERGAAIVWISHDLNTDGRHADRILALAQRTLVYDGALDGYLHNEQPLGGRAGQNGKISC